MTAATSGDPGDPGEDSADAVPSSALPRGLDRLAAAFSTQGITPVLLEHVAVRTVAEAQALQGPATGLPTKNLFLKDKAGRHFLVTLPHDAAVDLKRIHAAIGAKGRVSFGSADAMARMLGVAPGSVTPLGVINDDRNEVTCVFHPALAAADIIAVHPLRNTATVSLRRDDLFAIMRAAHHEPLVVALPEPDPG